MANEENLIPLNKRTKSEQREYQKKGGRASGEARRKKKQEKDRLQLLLGLKLLNPKMSAVLADFGIDEVLLDNETGVELALIAQALKGDIAAIKYIDERTGKNPALELRKRELSLKEKPAEPKGSSPGDRLVTALRRSAEAIDIYELDTAEQETDGGDELVDEE